MCDNLTVDYIRNKFLKTISNENVLQIASIFDSNLVRENQEQFAGFLRLIITNSMKRWELCEKKISKPLTTELNFEATFQPVTNDS